MPSFSRLVVHLLLGEQAQARRNAHRDPSWGWALSPRGAEYLSKPTNSPHCRRPLPARSASVPYQKQSLMQRRKLLVKRKLQPSNRYGCLPEGPGRQRCGHGDIPVSLPWGAIHMGDSPGLLPSLAGRTYATAAAKAEGCIQFPKPDSARSAECWLVVVGRVTPCAPSG